MNLKIKVMDFIIEFFMWKFYVKKMLQKGKALFRRAVDRSYSQFYALLFFSREHLKAWCNENPLYTSLLFHNMLCLGIMSLQPNLHRKKHTEKGMFRFWWPWPHFQGHTSTLNVKFWPKKLVCTLSLEPNDGFWPTFMYCIIGIIKRID